MEQGNVVVVVVGVAGGVAGVAAASPDLTAGSSTSCLWGLGRLRCCCSQRRCCPVFEDIVAVEIRT